MKTVTGPGLEELPARLCDGREEQHGVLAGRCVSVGAGLRWRYCGQCERDHFCACHAPSDLSRESGFRANLPTYRYTIITSTNNDNQEGLFPNLTLDYHHRSGEEVHILTTRAPG